MATRPPVLVLRALARMAWCRISCLLAAVFCSGCSTLDSPAATWQRWMARSRAEAADAAKEIKKDWNFHEDEGLENFGGGAAEQVRELRGELDRSATMSTY